MNAATSSRGRYELRAASSACKRPAGDSDSKRPRKRLPEPKIAPEKNENEQTALLKAAQEGDVRKISQLLAAGANTCSQDVRGQTPLHVALLQRKKAAAKLLVNCKNDVKDNRGRAALHIATELEYVGVMRKLISAGANIRVRDKDGRTPLHLALLHGKLAAAELLIDANSANDDQDVYGNTALHYAAKGGHISIVKKLLFNGVIPHLKNEVMQHAVDMAVEGFSCNCSPGCSNMLCYTKGWRETCYYDIVKIILAMGVWKNIIPDEHNLFWKVEDWFRLLVKCDDQIKVMKDRVMGDLTVSLYDILSQDVTKIARYLENRNTRKVLLGKCILKDFPNYTDMIEFKVWEAEERRVLTEEFLGCFAFATTRRPYLPETVTDPILFHLSNSDIQNFITATK